MFFFFCERDEDHIHCLFESSTCLFKDVMVCATLMGVSVEPYWLIATSSAVFFLLSVLANVLYEKCSSLSRSNLELQDPLVESTFTITRLLRPNNTVILLQGCIQLAHSIYIYCSTTNAELPSSDLYVQQGGVQGTGWFLYQVLIVRLANSGSMTAFMAQAYLYFYGHYFDDDLSTIKHYSILVTSVATGALFAGLVTHSMPMMFTYSWMTLPFGILAIVIYRLNLWWPGRGRYFSFLMALAVQVGVTALLTFYYQTTLHYGVLIYAFPHHPVSSSQYLDVIHAEFDLRSSKCYLESLESSIQSFFAFLSILF